MKKEEKNIIEVISQIISVTGNPFLENIFQENCKDKDKLYIALKDYLRGIYTDINEEREEDEENKKVVYNRFIHLNGIVLDATNISRIELDKEYNPMFCKATYYIRIIKKYPTPLEESFIIPFSSEKERDYGYEILKGKLKLLNINIF